MEQVTENDVDREADEVNEERLYPDSEISDDHENFVIPSPGSKEFAEGIAEEEDTTYNEDDSFIWGRDLMERGYEEDSYGKESLEDEEIGEEKSVPSSATFCTAEKSEEEAYPVVGPDHVLAEIPVEIFSSREAMMKKMKEFLAEQTELRRKNRLLESWISRHLRKTQEKMTLTDATKDPEEMEQIYRQALYTYKLQSGDMMERTTRMIADIQSYEDQVRTTRDEHAQIFDELLNREREVATSLIYAKTGRKLTEKTVNEIIRRQVLRCEILSRNRYDSIVLQQHLDQINTQLRNLETLGEGMTTMDYEALYMAYMSHKDKLDERDRELEKLRYKIAELVNGVAHHKEKEACLTEDIEFEEHELDEYREQTVRVRANVNRLHLIQRDLRRSHNEKRLEAGLLMAQPVLREMDRTMKLLDALNSDIEIIKHEIQHCNSANGRKEKSDQAPTILKRTQDKSGRF